MKKLRSFILWSLAIIIVLVLLAIAAIKVFFPPDKIVAAIIPRIEEVLDRKVEIGGAEFTLFGGIGARIYDVKIKNFPGFDREDFITIKKIDCQVKLWPLIKGDVVFSRLIIRDPEIILIKNTEGVTNYFSSEPEVGSPGDEQVLAAPLAFENFVLTNGRVIHRNDSTNVRIVLGNIDFRSSVLGDDTVRIAGMLNMDSLLFQSEWKDIPIYPAGFETDFVVRYITNTDSLLVDKFDISLEKIKGRLSGQIGTLTDNPYVDLALIAPEIEVNQFAQSQILAVFSTLNDVRLDGDMRLDATYRGLVADPDADNLRGKLSLSNFRAAAPRFETGLVIRLAEMNFNSRSISFFTEDARIGEVPASFRFVVDNFENPNLTADLKFSSGVEFLAQLAQLEQEAELSGKADISISCFVPLRERGKLRLLGSVELADFSLESAELEMPIRDVDLNCQFLGRDVEIRELSGKWGESDLKLTGRLSNFTPYLATIGEPVTRPLLEFELKSGFADLDEVFAEDDDLFEGDSFSLVDTLTAALLLLTDIDARGSIQIDHGIYNYVEFTGLTAQITALNRIVSFDSVRCMVYGGRVQGEAVVDLVDPLRPEFEIEYQAEGIEINGFLSRFTYLEDHLFGRVKMEGQFQGSGSEVLDILPGLTANGLVEMSSGRIVDFNPLRQFALDFGLDPVGDGTLRDLRSRFKVESGQVKLDYLVTEINGIPFQIEGAVGFDGALDCIVETTMSKRQLRYLEIPPQSADIASTLEGATVRFQLSGTYQSPRFKVKSITPAPRSLKENVDKAKNFLKGLFDD